MGTVQCWKCGMVMERATDISQNLPVRYSMCSSCWPIITATEIHELMKPTEVPSRFAFLFVEGKVSGCANSRAESNFE